MRGQELLTTSHLTALVVVIVAAPMVISPLEEVREVSHPASFVVLTHCGAGVESTCEYDRAAHVDSTGLTTINMLVNNKYISPHNYFVGYFKSKLAVVLPSCRIFSVVLGLS